LVGFSAAVDEEGVVKISDKRDFERWNSKGWDAKGEVTVFEVTGDNVKAVNTKESEGVGLTER